MDAPAGEYTQQETNRQGVMEDEVAENQNSAGGCGARADCQLSGAGAAPERAKS